MANSKYGTMGCACVLSLPLQRRTVFQVPLRSRTTKIGGYDTQLKSNMEINKKKTYVLRDGNIITVAPIAHSAHMRRLHSASRQPSFGFGWPWFGKENVFLHAPSIAFGMCSVSVQLLYTVSHTFWFFFFYVGVERDETVAGQASTVNCSFRLSPKKSKVTEISEIDSSKEVEETWTPNTSAPQSNLSQVNTIGCADEGLWIFSLEESKKRQHTVGNHPKRVQVRCALWMIRVVFT